MKEYDATETAYKNGYQQGVNDILEEIEKLAFFKIPPHIRPICKTYLGFEDGVRDGKTEALIEVLFLIAELKEKFAEEK